MQSDGELAAGKGASALFGGKVKLRRVLRDIAVIGIDFAIVATAFGADLSALKRAGLVGGISIVIGVVLSFVVGAVVAVAFAVEVELDRAVDVHFWLQLTLLWRLCLRLRVAFSFAAASASIAFSAAAPDADLSLSATGEQFLLFTYGRLTASDGMHLGRLAVTGEMSHLDQFEVWFKGL